MIDRLTNKSITWIQPIRTNAGLRGGYVCPGCGEQRLMPWGPDTDVLEWIKKHGDCA